tara:strand:- start:4408 stop:5733 length:1326 start_codon:yes stop_codon:yes gene_type:complete
LDANNVKKTLSKNILADGFEPIIDLKKSHDSWLVDARNGDEYLDMFSMYASGAIGYNHPEIIKNKELLYEVSLFKPTLSDIYSTHYADFLETFNRIAIPDYLNNAFFIEGGSLAVENALKIAFDWKVRKNLENGIKDKGSKVIHFEQAFHGRSGYTLSLTNTSDPRKTMYFPKFEWPRIKNPKLDFPINEQNLARVIKQENESLGQIHQAFKDFKDDIAAIIIEPIQGEGGDNHFRSEYIQSLHDICHENECLLIFDEVQTGIGITGKMWAHQNFIINNEIIKPDIISFGKKTQVCGALAGDRVLSVDNNVFKESSRINSTFGGNLVDMVRFKIILDTIDKFSLLDNANECGEYLLSKIHTLESSFPGFVSNSRGVGLFCAFDLPSGIERDRVISMALKNKMLILSSGDNTIRFRPHLTVTKEEIDIAIDILYKSIKEVLN